MKWILWLSVAVGYRSKCRKPAGKQSLYGTFTAASGNNGLAAISSNGMGSNPPAIGRYPFISCIFRLIVALFAPTTDDF